MNTINKHQLKPLKKKSVPTNSHSAPNQALGKIDSAFYIGNVFHKHIIPKKNQFNYPLYMAFLNLDEIDYLHSHYWWFSANRWAPLQLKVSDYFNSTPGSSMQSLTETGSLLRSGSYLKQMAIGTAQSLGADIQYIDRVCMLGQLRCFGFYFSPVNFFFLYQDNMAKYLLAEVSNKPWNKKHCYLINIDKPATTPKSFHVSPFMDMNMVYKWDIKPPSGSAFIQIENWHKAHIFTASFSANRHEINAKSLMHIFSRWPVITIIIVMRIYWQAAKLFLKGFRYVPYQEKATTKLNLTRSRTKKGSSHETI